MAEASFIAMFISETEGILHQLLSLANDQISLAWGFKQDLEKLRRRLVLIQAFLNGVEDSRITSAALMVWLKILKAATCNVENVLDELAYEDLRRKIEVKGPKTGKVRNLFSLLDPSSVRFKMRNKFNNINKQLDMICKEGNEMGLKPAAQVIGAIFEPRLFRESLPFTDDKQVVGRNGDVRVVIDKLLRSDLSVTAIVGMGGIGKTTLARVVFNEEKILKNFGEERMWIYVSDDFNVEKILNEMLQSLTGDKFDSPNIEGVARKLIEKLNGKKYLLVLDDVWNSNPDLWVELRRSLLGICSSKDCKILVTTRSMEVVLTMQTFPSYTHRLRELSMDDSWTLFWKRALAHREPSDTQTLEGIGKRMVRKCGGLPLAINILGGLLYSKWDKQEWESIDESELWILPLPVIQLCFDHLPSPLLKRSFAYCSIFPMGQVIRKDELIQLWMGLGYLQSFSESKVEMEEVGNEYFNTLLHNSLFHEVEFDEYNNITGCKMPELVHDFALSVSAGDCLTSEGEYSSHVQHLSLFLREKTGLNISGDNDGKLRTLFLKGHLPRTTNFIESIRALRLVESCVEELPTSISKFIHLRFLDISQSSIVKVPNFITKLYNLETLKLPWCLKELPKDFHNLVNLRHFSLGDTHENRELMPMKIGQLTSLQTLSFFVVGKEDGHRIEELGSLSKLRGRLRVFDLQHVKDKEEAEKAEMLQKSEIQELRLHWDRDLGMSDNNHEDVLEGLKPHPNVKGLIIENFGGRRLPSWMSGDACLLQNLVKIELRDCRLDDQVPVLGCLPHLAIIKMDGLHTLKCIGPEFYGLDEGIIGNCSSSAELAVKVFPALREFELINMPQLENWLGISLVRTDGTSTMEFFPRLQKLIIASCPKLISIPGDLLSIQQLHITSGLSDHHEQEMTYSRSLLIEVDRDGKNIAILLDGLLEQSNESLIVMAIVEMSGHHCHNLMGPKVRTEASFNSLTSLKQLSIKRCPELTYLPKGLLQPTLVDISLFLCPKLKALNPDALCSLTSLKKLEVIACPKLASCWEEGLFCTTSLQSLRIGRFKSWFDLNNSDHFPWPSTSTASTPWCNFTSLESLVLDGWPKTKSLPDQLEHLTSLRDLEIMYFSGLESLPEWLGKLASLQSLNIYRCGIGPVLEKRCQVGGEDWHKIAHIPSIRISSWP